jgi:cation diffusion facilitator CzcD-associated flavoprotein CzcO
MTEIVDVAIIGAGPYGLSIAAHLAGLGVDFRIFGSVMHTWQTSMPEGMVLKSEGNASSHTIRRARFRSPVIVRNSGRPTRTWGFRSR